MEFSLNPAPISSFNEDPFGNLLDDDIPQDIFDDIMNDINFNGIGGLDMNSLSSEDSGRSSSSYDDSVSTRYDNSPDQTMIDVSHFSGIIKEEPDLKNMLTENNNVIANTSIPPQTQHIFLQQNLPTNPMQQSHLILSQSQAPNILVKQEPLKEIKMQPQLKHQQQSILTVQNIGGNLFTTVTTTDQQPVHTIVNGTPGILTKIPILPIARIVSQTAVTASATTITSSVPIGGIHKTSKIKENKKSGHNIIERRYRTSINDKITELKNLVTGVSNAKMNKSGILKKSIEKIRSLEVENTELKMENRRLREMLSAQAINDSMPMLSPPTSNTASPAPDSPMNGDSAHETDQKIIFIQRGISPHSKFALCVFMFAVVALNGFGIVLNDRESNDFNYNEYDAGAARRTILSSLMDDPYNNLFTWKKFAMSAVNMLILLVCLIKLLVYGEPVIDRTHSDSATILKKTCENYFRNGDLVAASSNYLRLLQQYGIYLPASTNITWIELFTFTTWQMTRMFLYRLPFALWLSRKVGGLFCTKEVRDQAIGTHKEIGWILHRLNQIELIERCKLSNTEIGNRQHFYGIMISLYAVNLCEIAESQMFTKEMVEVYLTAALRVKAMSKYRFLSNYYLRKAKYCHLLSTSQNQQYEWIFTDCGYQFVTNTYIIETNNIATTIPDIISGLAIYCEPISLLQREYCKYLLTKALECLLGFRKVTSTKQNAFQQAEIMEVLTFAKRLTETMQFDENTVSESISWLSHIVTVAVHWRLDDLENSELLYDKTDKFPNTLIGAKSNDKALLKALFVAFIARRELIHSHRNGSLHLNEKIQLIRNRCNVASCLLYDHLTCSRSQNLNRNTLTHFVQILTCDWLLETRTECWEAMVDLTEKCNFYDSRDEGISEPYYETVNELEQYQRDLNAMHLIIDGKPLGQSRVNLYEAIYRLMAGATPLETHKIFERNILQSKHSKSNLICGGKGNNDDEFVCGERERALSIYLACRYLPAQVSVERAGLLTQAGAIFKLIGDINKANQCYQLINLTNQNGLESSKSD